MSQTAEPIFRFVMAGDAAAAVEAAGSDLSILDQKLNGATPVLTALYVGKEDVAQSLAELRPVTWFEAAALGDVERLWACLAEDGDCVNRISDDGFTAAHLAAAFRRPKAIQALAEAGADLSRVARSSFAKVAPLHSAVFGNDADTVRAVLEAGADPNQQVEGGFAPLHAAAQNGNLDVIRALLEFDADLELRDAEGRRAHDHAIEKGHIEAAKLLA